MRSARTAVVSILKKTALYNHFKIFEQARHISRWSAHDDRMADFYSKFAGPGDLVFDIGANIGNRVKIFVRLGLTTVAVEPQRFCASVLRRAFGRKATILQLAMSDRAGVADLYVSDTNILSSMSRDWIDATRESGRFRNDKWEKTVSVKTVTLDQLIASYGRPRFIKLDVEGFEATVLAGLSGSVPALSFEFTPEAIATAFACIARLEELGVYEYNFSFEDSMELSLPNWVSRDGIHSFLDRMRNDRVRFGDVYARLVSSAAVVAEKVQ
jgi:FkbM family methyltransferase